MAEAYDFFTNPELSPRRAYYAAVGLLRHKFAIAVQLQNETPGFDYVLLDEYPGKPEPLSTFVLADDYERNRRGEGESFEVSLPIQEADTDYPRLAEPSGDDYFVLTYRERATGVERSMVVDEPTFESEFIASQDPPIIDFQQKLITYRPIPARIHD